MQNAAPTEAAEQNQPAANYLATQLQDLVNSAVPNAPVQSQAEPPASILVVSADNASSVSASFSVQPVAL